jgi:hypothetical protein
LADWVDPGDIEGDALRCHRPQPDTLSLVEASGVGNERFHDETSALFEMGGGAFEASHLRVLVGQGEDGVEGEDGQRETPPQLEVREVAQADVDVRASRLGRQPVEHFR